MANIGTALVSPEAGWKRYEDTDSNFSYTDGTWVSDTTYDYHWTTPPGKVKFNFVGSKLRILVGTHPNHTNSVDVYVDGAKVCTFAENTTADRVANFLVCDLQNLSNQEHYVSAENTGSTNFTFQAIDIDEMGELKPYNPPTAVLGKILRVTMIDSSDHDYQLSADEIAAFVKWYNNHVSTDPNAYGLAKKIGNQSSTEYVAFEKIISFEVI